MDQNALIARLQAFFYIVRRGQWEKVLAVLTLAFFGAGEYLRREFKEVPQAGYAAYALCAAAAIWLFFRVWKQAAPPPPPPDKALPNAIKGLLPFTATDGALFARLGRRIELQSLLGLAQDDRFGISVVRGESGAGKTSLLQAGLAYTLGEERCMYWEAVPARAPEGLLHAIRSQLPGLDTLDALESLPDACPERCVLILDQFEQLRANEPEHAPVFSLLERIGKSPAPHRLSAVVGFRREYTPDWLDFEQAQGFQAEQVPVNLLAPRTASDVFVTLCGEAGFSLDQALVANFISSVSGQRGVSPVDVAIGVFSLANFVQQSGTSHVGVTEYELAGGAEGLLLSFVQQKLEEIPEAIRAPADGKVGPIDRRVASTLAVLKQLKTSTSLGLVVKSKIDLAELEQVKSLTSLTLDNLSLGDPSGLTSLPGLGRLKSLTTLTLPLGGSRIASLAGLEQLKSLTTLTIDLRFSYGPSSGITSLAGLEQLQSLTSLALYLGGSGVDSVAVLEQLKSLTTLTLDLTDSKITSLAGLKQLKSLTSLSLVMGSSLALNLGGSGVTSLAGLEQLKGLTSLVLDLTVSKITSLAELEQMKSLTSVGLWLPVSLVPQAARLKVGAAQVRVGCRL